MYQPLDHIGCLTLAVNVFKKKKVPYVFNTCPLTKHFQKPDASSPKIYLLAGEKMLFKKSIS